LASSGACGLTYTNPRCTPQEMQTYYPPRYGPHAPAGVCRPSWRHRLRILLYEVHYGQTRSLWKRAVYRLLGGLINFPPASGDRRLLDVGCGAGKVLALLKKMGFDTYGVENVPAVARRARALGLNVFAGELEQARYPDGFFDVVTMEHILEHLYFPGQTLREVRRVLKDDGRLLVRVPNIECWQVRILGGDWWGLGPPLHVTHFSAQTLEKLLRETGFEVERFGSPGLFLEGLGWNLTLLGRRHLQGQRGLARLLGIAGFLRDAAWLCERTAVLR